LIAISQTTKERLKGRYIYHVNPYDNKMWRNLVQFFTKKKKNSLMSYFEKQMEESKIKEVKKVIQIVQIETKVDGEVKVGSVHYIDSILEKVKTS